MAKKNDVFENEKMVVIASVEYIGEMYDIVGVLGNVMYIRTLSADGLEFRDKAYGIPKNVLNSRTYAELFAGYWYQATLQGFKRRMNSLAEKKDRTAKNNALMESIKDAIAFAEQAVEQNNWESVTYPTAIKSTVWAVNRGAWMSADGKERFWVLGGKGLADDIVSYATGKMSKADFKKSYCAYTAQWLQSSENGDAELFGDLFRNFTPKATDLMLSDLVNCYKGVKVDYNESGIHHKGIKGQALTAQAVLQMLKTVYKFDEKNVKKTVKDSTI